MRLSQNDKMAKADFIEYIETELYRFLIAFLRDYMCDISNKDRMLLYFLFFRHITTAQMQRLFRKNASHGGTVSVYLSRLKTEGYLESLVSDDVYFYSITDAGISYALPFLYALSKEYQCFLRDNISFDMIGEAIRSRLSGMEQPARAFHYFGIRDVFFALVNDPRFSKDFLFRQEVIVDSGEPLSIYQTHLNNLNRTPSSLISDGFIQAYCNAYPALSTRLFIEMDSGSQRAFVIIEKLRRYIANCKLATVSYAQDGSRIMPPSVLFLISSKYCYFNRNEGKMKKIGSTGLFDTIRLVVESFAISSERPVESVTLADALEELSILANRKNKLAKKLHQDLTDYVAKQKLSLSTSFLSAAANAPNYNTIKAEKVMAYFENRKKLLYEYAFTDKDCVSSFLTGFSFYLCPHDSISDTMPFICPELFGFGNILRVIYSDRLRKDTQVAYRNIGHVGKHLLRNAYTITDSDQVTYHCFVENIGDDIGGAARVRAILSDPDFAFDDATKILCLCSEKNMQGILPELLTYEKAISGAYLRLSRPGFLFMTYQEYSQRLLFQLAADGSRCYI